jgi:hypothetical protein
MKTFVKTIALAVVLATSFAFFAFNTFADVKESKKITGFSTGIYVSKAGRLHIGIDKHVDGNTAISLLNYQGKVVYREVFGKRVDKVRRAIDVSSLPLGKYTLEVFSNGEKLTKDVEITSKETDRTLTIK